MTAQARQVVGVPRRQLLLAAVLGLLVAAVVVGAGAYLLLRQTSAADSWPGFRGDAGRSGAAATGPVGNPVLAWQFHAAGGFHGDLAIAGDLVLGVSDDGVLHALGITDGVERWTHPIANTVRGPFVIDGRVYVAGGDGIVHALNLTDGSTYWSTSAGYLGPSDLSLRDGHLYVGTTDGLVAAIDAASGRELWHTAISPANAPVHGPSTASGVVVAATDDGYLADLDPASGAIRWRIQASPLLVGTPVLGPGVVYLGRSPDSVNGHLAAFDLGSGTERWRIQDSFYAPALADGVGYSTSSSGELRAFDLSTGTQRWSTKIDGKLRAPVVAGDIVYVAGDTAHTVQAFDRPLADTSGPTTSTAATSAASPSREGESSWAPSPAACTRSAATARS